MLKQATKSISDKIEQMYRFAISTAHGRIFTVVLLLKIFTICIVAPKLYVHWFVPFIKNFINSGYQNPWDSFLSAGGDMRAFPYGTGMLVILTIPFALVNLMTIASPQIINNIDLLLMKIPILVADSCILYLLIHSMNIDAKKSIYIYWCSPVAFYISYIFGQLDVIPMMLMVASLVLLIKNHFLYSAIVLGIGLATKENLFFAVPFLLIYAFKKERSWRRLISYGMGVVTVYILMIGPVFFSQGYSSMVLGATERNWIYLSSVPFGDFEILLLPLTMGFLYLKFSLYRKVNEDILIMYLGLAFTVLLLFIPAATPGWYMWIIPFLCYYFINLPRFNLVPLIVFSVMFLMFFLTKVPYPLNLIDNSSKSLLAGLFGSFLSESNIGMSNNLILTF